MMLQFTHETFHIKRFSYVNLLLHTLASFLTVALSFAGKGALVIYEEVRGQSGGFREVNRCVWKDGLFDVTWSEANEAILVAGSGDGNLLIVDQSAVGRPGPAAVLSGHTAEVCH